MRASVPLLAALRIVCRPASAWQVAVMPACVVSRIPVFRLTGSRHIYKSSGSLFYSICTSNVQAVLCFADNMRVVPQQ